MVEFFYLVYYIKENQQSGKNFLYNPILDKTTNLTLNIGMVDTNGALLFNKMDQRRIEIKHQINNLEKGIEVSNF